jgi:two-component system, OmpR family, response regulator VicR
MEQKKDDSKKETTTNNRTVLLVEDDKYICKAYREGLEREGFEVTVAYDGNEALERVKNSVPDVILLDIAMPGKNGFEVLEELRMSLATKEVPVVILSNLGQDSDVKKATELGATDYLIKANYPMKEVIEKVKFHTVKE